MGNGHAGSYTDDELIRLFREGTFPIADFTHKAHLRLAWIYLQRFGPDTAEREVCRQIQHYTRLHGATDKYHHTLTVAAVRMVGVYMKEQQEEGFEALLTRFPELLDRFKELLSRHYSEKVLWSQAARLSFQEPDLKPFNL